MACMKCGKKTDRTKVFCDECLDKMAEFPIDQNTVVNLPPRAVSSVAKKKTQMRRYFWDVEGENDTLRSKIRWLYIALTAAILGFVLTSTVIVVMLFQDGKLDFLFQWWPF